MGLRGPAPKPTAIKRLEGNPGKRKLNETEPKLTMGVPECPDYLDDVAKKEWGRLTTILTAMKVLTEADYIALANLCQAYSTLMNAQRQMNKTGILYKSKSGYIQQSPLLGIIHTQTTIVKQPAARVWADTVEPHKGGDGRTREKAAESLRRAR
jgi:P27 family predicted phage terminase small subunit